jgi:hypothetical protein
MCLGGTFGTRECAGYSQTEVLPNGVGFRQEVTGGVCEKKVAGRVC